MPVDRYRITGPETTFPLSTLAPPPPPSSSSSSSSSLAGSSTAVSRPDGRPAAQLRPIYMSTGTVSHANGSAYLELAGTRVMAAVYGPRENTRAGGLQQFNEQAVLQCDVARAPFASPRDDARIGTDANTSAAAADRQFATSVATALQSSVRLEKYAKSSIDLFVTIIGDDGGALAAAINCCTLALADAGIEMNDMVTAASVALAANTNIVLWDPTHVEESRASAIATQALRVSDNLVTLLDQSGESSLKLSVKALEACSSMSVQLHGLMQQTLVSSLLERRKQQLLP